MTWTLRRKILFGYGIALFLLAFVFVLSFVNLRRLGQASEAILSENYRSIGLEGGLRGDRRDLARRLPRRLGLL